MDRMTVDQEVVTRLRTGAEADYPSGTEPLPGTALKIDDHVEWIGFAKVVVLWGYDTPEFFCGYCPEYFGEMTMVIDGEGITDRAPADPNETPMPIYPQQQQQRQGKADARTQEQRLRDLVKLQPNKEVGRKMQEVFKQRGLLPGGGKDDEPGKGGKTP